MLEAPGGGGGTPWESMSVTEMQALIQNPDTNRHYDLVDGWKKSAELVVSHRFQVQSYRDNLAAVWPPAKSPASAAYLARLDLLIDNLTETYEAALANHDALASATLSISLAQQSMEQIHQEYTINQQLLLDFSAKQQAQQNSPTPQPSPGPSGAEPPVAPDRQEALRQQAVTLLSSVSSDLAQAQVRLVRPTLYPPATSLDDNASSLDGTTYVAPPIPPIAPSYAGNNATAAGSSGSSNSLAGGNAGTDSPSSFKPGTGSQQPGLVLGGTNTPIANLPTTGSPALPPTQGGTTAPLTSPPFVPQGVNNFPPNAGANLPREGLLRPANPASAGLRTMQPGGMIGGVPGVGLGQPPVARPAARRVNPVGGVIGEGAQHGIRAGNRGISSGEHASGYGTAYGQGGSRRSSQADETSHWDPDNPWQTAEGVAPVVLPAREQRIDPGPAIGLP